MSIEHEPLTGDQAQLVRPTNSKRVSVRYKCGLATPGRVHLQGEEWQRAWVLNLSLHGVGLLLSRALDPGKQVVVYLGSGATGTAYEFAARVCHATQQRDGEWVIGCEFMSHLTDDQLDGLLQ